MIEIGKSKVVKIRKLVKNADGKSRFVAQLDSDGKPETKIIPAAVWRVTRDALGHNYGCDKNRRLVVGFVPTDMLAIRPQGTTRGVQARLVDIYAWILRSQAQNAILARARDAKARKAQRLANARQRNAEKRLFRT